MVFKSLTYSLNLINNKKIKLMSWLKFTHSDGTDLINLSKVLRISQTSDLDITIYDSNSIIPITFSFGTPTEANHFFYKLNKVIDTIDLDSLSIEYFLRD